MGAKIGLLITLNQKIMILQIILKIPENCEVNSIFESGDRQVFIETISKQVKLVDLSNIYLTHAAGYIKFYYYNHFS